jgi:hypothetical protein
MNQCIDSVISAIRRQERLRLVGPLFPDLLLEFRQDSVALVTVKILRRSAISHSLGKRRQQGNVRNGCGQVQDTIAVIAGTSEAMRLRDETIAADPSASPPSTTDDFMTAQFAPGFRNGRRTDAEREGEIPDRRQLCTNRQRAGTDQGSGFKSDPANGPVRQSLGKPMGVSIFGHATPILMFNNIIVFDQFNMNILTERIIGSLRVKC